jgi:hypothetical protein
MRRKNMALRVDYDDPWDDGTIRIDDAPSGSSTVKVGSSVKDAITKITKILQMQKVAGQSEPMNMHFVFMVKPEAEKEKTKVAHTLADLFKDAGLLPTNNVVEVDRSKMVGAYVGLTAKLVNEQCDKAMGGILLIHEANNLIVSEKDAFGKEAVDSLLMRMEKDRGKFVVIAAGSTKEMNAFLQLYPGLKARITDCINFDE